KDRESRLFLQECTSFGSVLSVYSGDFGNVDAQGTVEFALDYDEKNREFQVHVSQCKDLAVKTLVTTGTFPFITEIYSLCNYEKLGLPMVNTLQ
uniref:Uncharacterized protein n=1 Tax=Pavo cristatus TaxID=9049 RepID=A0A8C9G130_PAVCR